MSSSRTKSLQVPAGLLVSGIDACSEAGHARKCAFHADGRRFLKALAAELGLAKGCFEVRANLGGIAVSGEVTLHSETLYVQMYESCIGSRGVSVLYRRCRGRRDYCGETNHFVAVESLVEDWRLRAFVAELRVLGRLEQSGRLAA